MVGVCGNEKASDVVVTVDLNTENGIEIKLLSKLEKLFGKLIVKSVQDALDEMSVQNAVVKVEDFGALDFVIKARTKTAVRRALAAQGRGE